MSGAMGELYRVVGGSFIEVMAVWVAPLKKVELIVSCPPYPIPLWGILGLFGNEGLYIRYRARISGAQINSEKA